MKIEAHLIDYLEPGTPVAAGSERWIKLADSRMAHIKGCLVDPVTGYWFGWQIQFRFDDKVEVPDGTEIVVFCIALDDPSVGGSEWRLSRDERDYTLRNIGNLGYKPEQATPFTLRVPANASNEEITNLVDEAAHERFWEATNEQP